MQNIKKLLILRGLQGSGKSTFAKKWVAEDPEHRVRFNRDDMRNMLGPYWIPSREKLINSLYNTFLEEATFKGYDIVIDNMNLNDKCIQEIETFCRESNEYNRFTYEVEIKDFFNVPLEICIERDAERDKPVGEKVIRQTYNKYKDKIIPWKYLN